MAKYILKKQTPVFKQTSTGRQTVGKLKEGQIVDVAGKNKIGNARFLVLSNGNFFSQYNAKPYQGSSGNTGTTLDNVSNPDVEDIKEPPKVKPSPSIPSKPLPLPSPSPEAGVISYDDMRNGNASTKKEANLFSNRNLLILALLVGGYFAYKKFKK